MNTETRAFVVMGNDYPDAVFSTKEAAEAHCEAMRKEGLVQYRQMHGRERPSYDRGIYWRVYDFPLLEGVSA